MNPASRRTEPGESREDAELVRAAQQGDSRAFDQIVVRYQRAIHRVAYGLTRNAADADDLAQETFVRAYRAIDRFRVGEPLYPWLSRIAVNLAYSLFRQRRRRPEAALDPMVEAGHEWANEDDPVGETAEREHHEKLHAAFGELSPEHQAILVLRAVDGLSYDEIARSLSIPIGTVMSRLSRARSDLKTRLAARTGENP